MDNKIALCGLMMAFRAILEKAHGERVDYLFYPHGGYGEYIRIAANGCIQPTILVRGKKAGTSRLEKGINPIQKANKLLTHLFKLADEVNSRKHRLPGTESDMQSGFSIARASI